jgi:hypothetical protein
VAKTEITWDGHNLAAIQLATACLARDHGRPCAEVDKDWNLTVYDFPVLTGQVITIDDELKTVDVHAT